MAFSGDPPQGLFLNSLAFVMTTAAIIGIWMAGLCCWLALLTQWRRLWEFLAEAEDVSPKQ